MSLHPQTDAVTNWDTERTLVAELCRQHESDAMTMALRLYGESDDTFAPETIEVMARWRPKVEKLLRGEG